MNGWKMKFSFGARLLFQEYSLTISFREGVISNARSPRPTGLSSRQRELGDQIVLPLLIHLSPFQVFVEVTGVTFFHGGEENLRDPLFVGGICVLKRP